MSGKRDNIYLNISINQNPTYGTQPSPAVYSLNSNIPVLDKPSDYYMSVVRGTFPLDNVPLVIFPLDITQNNPYVSDLIFGINYLGVKYPSNVVYVAQSNLPVPIPNGTPPFFNNSQATNAFYFIYDIVSFLEMFNDAIASSMITSGLSGLGIPSPYFYFDPPSQLISLVVNDSFITSGAVLYCNEYCIDYLISFTVFYVGSNQPQGYDFTFTLLPTPRTQPGPVYTYQENFISIYNWFALRKILVKSETIPIATEYTPAQNNSTGQPVNGQTAQNAILTDFIPPITSTNEVRSIAYYNPTSQYRLIDLFSDSQLSDLTLKVEWQDRNGNVYPLLISHIQQASLKLAFIRKDLYKNGNLALKM
jgi:hypothetical protein